MATSSWLQDLQAPRPAAAVAPAGAPPGFSSVSAPSLPSLSDEARAPGFTERTWIGTQLGALPGKYDPQLALARDQAKAGLAGYGGWSWREDDPSTPGREDLQPIYDPNNAVGERERAAVGGARAQAAGRGMLYSTGAQQGIGRALQQTSDEARAVISQFAGQVGGIFSSYNSEATGLVNRWTELYGSDSLYLGQNPPPAPEPPKPWASLPRFANGEIKVGTYRGVPNLETLKARYPGLSLQPRRMGGGGYIVVGREV